MLLHFSQTLLKHCRILFTFLPHVPSGLAPSHVVSAGGSVRLCQQWLTSLSELSDSTLLTRYPLLRFMSGFVAVSILTASVTSLFIVVSWLWVMHILNWWQGGAEKSDSWNSRICWANTESWSLFSNPLRCSLPREMPFLEVSPTYW